MEQKKVKESVLNKFEIEIGNINDCLFVSVDPGAGDWSSARALIVGGSFEGISDLYVSNDGETRKDAAVLQREGERWNIGKAAALAAINNQEAGGFFENYKVPPCSPYAYECYGNDFNNPNYRELMKRSFQCIINRLFSEAKNELVGTNLILLVGRPSSADWENDEISYRNLLMDGLEVPGFEAENVQMAVVSEAQAALASEVYEQGLDTNQLTFVIDIGSSTLDIVVVGNGGGKRGEYSRQIGSGHIEANMLELAMYDDCDPHNIHDVMKQYFSDAEYGELLDYRDNLRQAFQAKRYVSGDAYREFRFSNIPMYYEKLMLKPALLRYELRDYKEQYFGKDGKGGHRRGSYSVDFEGDTNINLRINDELMEKALRKMPIFVPCTESDSTGNPYMQPYIYRSYYDAVSHFLDGVGDMFLKDKRKPKQIIITGGAAVMPFIKELVTEKFGVAPSTSTHPSYTVSTGLAYIGYAEAKKREELEAINKLIDEKLQAARIFLQNAIQHSFVTWFYDQLINKFKAWAGSAGNDKKFQDFVLVEYEYLPNDISDLDLLEKWWLEDQTLDQYNVLVHRLKKEGVKSEIVLSINDRFNALYSKTDAQYEFSVDPDIVVSAYTGKRRTEIQMNYTEMLGVFQMFDGGRCYPLAKRQQYLQKAYDHKSGCIKYFKEQSSVKNLAQEHTATILGNFKRILRADVERYVEGLTPYIIKQ